MPEDLAPGRLILFAAGAALSATGHEGRLAECPVFAAWASFYYFLMALIPLYIFSAWVKRLKFRFLVSLHAVQSGRPSQEAKAVVELFQSEGNAV